MNRKEFIHKLIINGSLIVIPGMVVQSCEKDDPTDNSSMPTSADIEIDLDDPVNSALAVDGGSIVVSSGKIRVINLGSNNFVALSTRCTHNGCTVGYNQANQNLPCPCHGSLFDIDGSVINGPASSPLKSYPLTVGTNKIIIIT